MRNILSTQSLAIRGGDPIRVHGFHSWPVYGSEEETALREVLHSGMWWYGEKVKAFEQRFSVFHDATYGVSCCNGTVALEVILRALGIAAGDEVLVPAYTFISTATSVLTANAKPVFVDVCEDTYNMDLRHAEGLVTQNTKAMIVVHFAGLPIDMDAVRGFSERHNLMVIEDAAHAWGSQWKGTSVGALEDAGTFSFQLSKNMTSGEGGIILTNNQAVAELARSYTHCGRMEGCQWYEHIHVGGNYRLTEFQAALLLQQLDRLEEQTIKREANARYLNERLAQIPGIHLPVQDKRVTRRSYHLYMFRYMRDEFGSVDRRAFIAALNAEGIPANPGYLTPVYGNRCFQDIRSVPGLEHCESECGCEKAAVDYREVMCPVTERLCRDEAIWLPHHILLGTTEDMESIVSAVEKVYEHRDELLEV